MTKILSCNIQDVKKRGAGRIGMKFASNEKCKCLLYKICLKYSGQDIAHYHDPVIQQATIQWTLNKMFHNTLKWLTHIVHS